MIRGVHHEQIVKYSNILYCSGDHRLDKILKIFLTTEESSQMHGMKKNMKHMYTGFQNMKLINAVNYHLAPNKLIKKF